VPIRLRLALLFALGTAVLVAVAGFVFADQLRTGLVSSLDTAIRARADTSIKSISAGPFPTAGADGTPASLAGSLTQVVDASGKVVADTGDTGHTSLLGPAQLQAARHGVVVVSITVDGVDDNPLAGEQIRLRAAPVGTAVVIVASSLETTHDATTRVRHAVTFGGPPVVLVAGLGAWLLAGGALRPVERMRREVADISEHGAESSIVVPGTHDEVAALAATMNDVLGRLKTALDRERRFIADAGHELRTPLTILQGELELAARPGRTAADLREAVDTATGEVGRLAALAEDLLTVGRQSAPARNETIRLADLARAATDGFASPAAERRVGFRLDVGDNATAQGDPGQIRRVVDNLLDNALRYAPSGTDITVFVGRSADRAIIEVCDQGPGFPTEFVAHAFERFRRADDARSRDGGGTGLGLAIVHEIVAAHRGVATVSNRAEGGAVVRIELPCPPR
jgi:two-component system OmpR family sensor kinase